jgi:glycosyltransferase involved in cell wall biosynthesis
MGNAVAVLSPEPRGTVASGDLIGISQSRSSTTSKTLRSTFLGRQAQSILFAGRALVWMRGQAPDCAVISFHTPLLVFLIAIVAKMAASASIVDAQDAWLYSQSSYHGRFRNRIRRGLERAGMLTASKVTTVTPTLARMIVKGYRLPRENVAVVYNGASVPTISEARDRDIDLLHLGSPRQYYDTSAFIDALGRLHLEGERPRTVFLGCTEDLYVRSMVQHAEKLGLQKHVRFVPPVAASDVSRWLQRSSIGIFTLQRRPEHACAIGVKVFEYLSMGLPVIHLGPRDGETATLLREGDCGLVAETVGELASHLTRLLRDDALRMQMGIRARNVARRFTWSAAAGSMMSILESTQRRT